jgi:hypothetical protein
LSVVRNNLANGSSTTSSTDTGTDGIADSGLGSLSVLVDRAGSRSGSGDTNGTIGVPDRLSSSVSLDGCGPGGSTRSELVSVNVVSSLFVIDQAVGSTSVELLGVGEGLVVDRRGSRGSSGSSSAVGNTTFVVVGSVGSSAG